MKIRDYFVNQRGFTNPDLTIGDLAEQLAEPVRDVSHVVNHHLARNFYDLVNGYRVQAAERIFTTAPASTATITDVMYQVGFSSKSSFNTQFKQKTGLTPSEYRRKARLGSLAKGKKSSTSRIRSIPTPVWPESSSVQVMGRRR
jgi:AraC-like DNA-binding protein